MAFSADANCQFALPGRHPYITSRIPITTAVNSKRHSSLNGSRAFSRVLSFLLLGFIFYGTTLEAVHKHGRVGELSSQGAAVQQTGKADESANLAAGSDCLICQLHQNFSSAVTAARHVSPLPRTVAETFLTNVESLQTRISSTGSGRSPPFIS